MPFFLVHLFVKWCQFSIFKNGGYIAWMHKLKWTMEMSVHLNYVFLLGASYAHAPSPRSFLWQQHPDDQTTQKLECMFIRKKEESLNMSRSHAKGKTVEEGRSMGLKH